MAVHCRQVAEGEPDQEHVIAPHYDGQTDATLLAAKSQGAIDKGWEVEWTGPDSFVAKKLRWGGVLVTRTFGIR